MKEYIFLYRIKNTSDRDACAYIENKALRWECDHYFGGVNLHGSCYCGHEWAQYEDIETILTEEEYNALKKFDKDINSLGFSITKGDDRYLSGIWLCESIQPIFDKLNSEEAQEFFNQIWEEEKEYLMNEYSLDEEDINTITDAYYLPYRDRSIVGYVYRNTEDLGYEEAYSMGYISNDNSVTTRYFDYAAFGEDLAREEGYCELPDGRVVSLMY